jgi:monofunctional biosynthetic peptidoglycan transglycosylase
MKRLGRWLLVLILVGLVVFVLPVLALRWLPAPTSAFMLQSEVQPVRYQWVSAEQIPETARRAVVASEDQKFFEHAGFDIEAMQKAYANNQKKGRRVRGASTISQQTAKNLFLWSGGGYFRKGIEALYTVLIEALWPKQRILTVYLNIAEFGPGLYGVEAAAQTYFGKRAAQLTAAEAARLAAVLPSPRKWKVTQPGPYVQRRAAWILGQMGYGRRPARPEPEPEPPPELAVDSATPDAETPDRASGEVAPDAAAEAALQEALRAEALLEDHPPAEEPAPAEEQAP